MAFLDEAVALAIALESERIRAAVLAVPAVDNLDSDLNALLDVFDDGIATAADVPNAFGPAVLDLCRFVGRENDPDLQAIAFYDALAATKSENDQVATIADCGLVYGLALSIIRKSYAARRDALGARSDFLAAAGIVQNVTGVHLGADVFDWLSDVVGAASSHLSETAGNRMPLVTVETAHSYSSTLLAHRLYADPQRAGELVDRNLVLTPLFLPIRLEGLAA